METGSMIIKIKGISAVNALSTTKPLIGTVKLKGVAAGAKLGELEATRVLATKKGLLLHGVELEAPCVPAASKTAAGKAALGGKAALAKGAVAKGATSSKVVGGKAALGTGAALSAKSAGLGLGLGGLGPWLALGALGLAATGIYLYLRAQQPQDAFQEPDELESPV